MGDRLDAGQDAGDDDDERLDTDSEAKFEEVVEHLRAWTPEGTSSRAAPQRLQLYLEEQLNGDASSVWDQDIVERRRGSAEANLVINGEIGVKLVRSIGPTTVKSVRVTLGLLAERYNYVGIYWLDATSDTVDYRRSVERRASTTGLGLHGLAFVTDRRPAVRLDATQWAAPSLSSFRAGIGAAVFAAAGAGAIWWFLTHTSGFGQLLLVLVGGVFLGTLALGGFLATL
jgi:hypothetical protein